VANLKRDKELSEVVQAIREMVYALLRNQRHEGINESIGLAKFRGTKHSQFTRAYNLEKAEL